jgi:hypothetical protein
MLLVLILLLIVALHPVSLPAYLLLCRWMRFDDGNVFFVSQQAVLTDRSVGSRLYLQAQLSKYRLRHVA